MNLLVLLTVTSSICSILSFITSKFIKFKKWIWILAIFVMTFLTGYIVYLESEWERINNIHRKATVIYEHYDSYYPQTAYVEEVLTFLEENKDTYPDAYERAKGIYSELKKPHSHMETEAAMEMHGIIKGIMILNEK